MTTIVMTYTARDKWVRRLGRDSELTHATYKVGSVIAHSLRTETGELSLQKVECIADACAMNRSTVMSALRTLVRRGWLNCIPGGQYKPNQYTLAPIPRSEITTLHPGSEIPTPTGSEIPTSVGSEIPTEVKQKKKAKRSLANEQDARARARVPARVGGSFGKEAQREIGKEAQREITAEARNLEPGPRATFAENDFMSSDGSVKFTHEEIEAMRTELPDIPDIRAAIRFACRWAQETEPNPRRRKEAILNRLGRQDVVRREAKIERAERTALRVKQAEAADKRREERDRPFHLLP